MPREDCSKVPILAAKGPALKSSTPLQQPDPPDTDELNQLLDALLASGDHDAIDEIAEFIEEHLRAQQTGVPVDETASLTRSQKVLQKRGTDLKGL